MLERLAPAIVMLAGFAYAVGLRRLWTAAGSYRLVNRAQAGAFAAAIATLLVALASPLDSAVDHDLPLHMVQHVLLLAVVPPLLAVSAPAMVVGWVLPTNWRRRYQALSRRVLRSQGTATGWVVWTAGAFAVATLTLALWHLPALYDAAVRDDSVHALEHITFVATATLFWWMALGVAGARAAAPA